MNKYFIYAVIVSIVTSGSSWMRATSGSSNYNSGYRGSTWSSNTGGGGGSYGGGSGGGGHK